MNDELELTTVSEPDDDDTLRGLVLTRLEHVPLCLTVNLFSRKIPGLNVYAQMQNEKEQEMMSPANPTETTPGSQQDLVPSLESLDTDYDPQPFGKHGTSDPSGPLSLQTSVHLSLGHCGRHETHPVLSVVSQKGNAPSRDAWTLTFNEYDEQFVLRRTVTDALTTKQITGSAYWGGAHLRHDPSTWRFDDKRGVESLT